MSDLAVLFVIMLGVFGLPGGYLYWLAKAPRGRMPRGWSDRARLRCDAGGVRAVADAIHVQLRADVIALMARGERPRLTCGGRATPPGPTRLVLEHRLPGDRPGKRMVAIVTRAPGGRDRYAIELRGSSPHLFGMPRTPAALALHAVAGALERGAPFTAVEWSADGQTWTPEPNGPPPPKDPSA